VERFLKLCAPPTKGKRSVRTDSFVTRNFTAEHLEKEYTLFYKTKKASELMESDDDLEHPHLYFASVCRNA